MDVQYPLLVFTLLTGFAVGSACIGAVAELINAFKRKNTYEQISRWGGYLAAPAIFVGLLASTLHLTKPLAFWAGLSHVGTSWISNEGLAGILFLGFIVLYAMLQFFSDRESSRWKNGKSLVGLLAGLLGLALLYNQGMAYVTVRPIAAWNTPLTLGFFVISSLLLGALGLATVLAIRNKIIRDEVKEASFMEPLKLFVALCTILLVLQTMVAGMWLIHLRTGSLSHAATESLNLILGPLLVRTVARVIIGNVIPLVLLGCAWIRIRSQPQPMSILLIVSFIFVLVGDIIARQLFFMVAIHI